MDLNFCFSPAIELTGSNHMRYRRELIPLLYSARPEMRILLVGRLGF